MSVPRITWDMGTAYDFFVSLHILHHPSDFGVRAAWAAGMRSRLPAAEREFLEDVTESALPGPPIGWVYTLPAPKDSVTALEMLEEIPSSRRLPTLMPLEELGEKTVEMLDKISRQGSWDEDDRELLRSELHAHWGKKSIADKYLDGNLRWWSQPGEFGEKLVNALYAYQEVFFAEEERRIRPVLESELENAQALAEKVSVQELMETLSQGLRFQSLPQVEELILAPSYWGSPFVFFGDMRAGDKELLLFGARPKDASLIPGEIIPDSLINALKALSDPTRLRILRYLTSEPLTPTQLARRLRLRAPTVIHHLHILRAAGLVYVIVGEGKEKAYQSRSEGVMATCDLLGEFLNATESGDQ